MDHPGSPDQVSAAASTSTPDRGTNNATNIRKGGGYIKVWRSVRDSPVYSLTPAQRIVFFEILLTANWKGGRWRADGRTITVTPGQRITTLQKLADGAGVSKGCVRRALAALESLEIIRVEAAQRWTKISVVNWGKYQDSLEGGGTTVDPRTDPRTDPNRRRKKEEETHPGVNQASWCAFYQEQYGESYHFNSQEARKLDSLASTHGLDAVIARGRAACTTPWVDGKVTVSTLDRLWNSLGDTTAKPVSPYLQSLGVGE